LGTLVIHGFFANQLPNYSQQESVILAGSLMLAGMGFVIPFAFKKFLRIRKHPPRKGWTIQEKEIVRNRQHGECNKCHEIPPRWDYHHRDGNRSNNRLSNCEGLCPNCHSVKTYD